MPPLLFRKTRFSWISITSVPLALLLTGVVLVPWISPFNYRERAGTILQTPGKAHWLGTDELGRDVLVRLAVAGRISLAVGLTSALAAALLGTLVGVAAGLGKLWLDHLLMRLADVFLSIPALPVLMILASVDLESLSEFLQRHWNARYGDLAFLLHGLRLVLAVAVFGWMGTARLVRAEVISLREREFMRAARAAGVGKWRICYRHLLPHCLAPVQVATAVAVGNNILYEAVLGFLGLAFPPPYPSWGSMLHGARVYSYYRAPWLIYFPGICITVTVFCVNLVADQMQAKAKRDTFR